MPHVLVTGAAGYIGSHCCFVLLEAGYHVTAVDSLSVGKRGSLDRVRKLVPDHADKLLFRKEGTRGAWRLPLLVCAPPPKQG